MWYKSEANCILFFPVFYDSISNRDGPTSETKYIDNKSSCEKIQPVSAEKRNYSIR